MARPGDDPMVARGRPSPPRPAFSRRNGARRFFATKRVPRPPAPLGSGLFFSVPVQNAFSGPALSTPEETGPRPRPGSARGSS